MYPLWFCMASERGSPVTCYPRFLAWNCYNVFKWPKFVSKNNYCFQVNFGDYEAIISLVNENSNHWKLLVIKIVYICNKQLNKSPLTNFLFTVYKPFDKNGLPFGPCTKLNRGSSRCSCSQTNSVYSSRNHTFLFIFCTLTVLGKMFNACLKSLCCEVWGFQNSRFTYYIFVALKGDLRSISIS